MGGGGAGTRTPDTEIMILLLYQLSYAAHSGHPVRMESAER